jgi:H+/Cl- antiporter ClcA
VVDAAFYTTPRDVNFYGTVRLRQRFPAPDMLKPAVAGLMVGLIGLAFPAAAVGRQAERGALTGGVRRWRS